jgi:signal transduction histidine kinase/HAMP domain-containing protein
MSSSQLSLGIFDLVGVIMLVLAGSSFIYLLRVGNKSRSTWMLLWFFLCVILSSCATIVTNIGTAWDSAFAPAQDAMLILGGVFLVRFAYFYPERDQEREARWVVTFFTLVALAALTYAVIFAIRYIANLPGNIISENNLYYLITPIAISLVIIVFFRRSIHWSFQMLSSNETISQRNNSTIKYLIKPNNRSSSALRSYGLSLATSLVPTVALIDWIPLTPFIASFLFNFGAVIAISALMLTYLNYAPESVSISAKLVGISMVSVLLILGFAGVTLFHTIPGLDEHSLVSTFITLVLLSSALIILFFPVFFRTSLLDPLAKLLRGVKSANDGDLSVQVPVQYVDEIGFLTQSFNHMIHALNEATQTLKNETAMLEKRVAERTEELYKSNQLLISENAERKEAQAKVDRQLRYEEALANCSRSLLLIAPDDHSKQRVLEIALEHLRIGVYASRAYIFRNFEDSDLGLCVGMQAEVCAPDIPPHIHNLVNQKTPWSLLPKEMSSALEAGNPYGGPVEQAFASAPTYLENFLHQSPPLLSVQTFPIFYNNQWWGFVGYDDCETRREWDEAEILSLRTASEMIGNTLNRWQAEDYLHDALIHLEERVQERTIELAQTNAELRYENFERKHFQTQLEERLKIEEALAEISARLVSPVQPDVATQKTIADLGQILQANRVVFIETPFGANQMIGEINEWTSPGTPPFQSNWRQNLDLIYTMFQTRSEQNKAIYFDIVTLPKAAKAERRLLNKMEVDSLIILPVNIENHLTGVIVCSNMNQPMPIIAERIPFGEMVASMLGRMLQRDALLNMLEEKVAERTHELSTLFDMAILSSEAHEISEIMQPALSKVMEISFSEAGLLHLYDNEKHTFELVAMRGIPHELHSKFPTSLSEDLLMEWQASIFEGNGAETFISSTAPEDFMLAGFQTAIHIPLRARGKNQGLLSCYRQEKITYNPYQISLLNAIGEQLGMVVENHRLRLRAEEVATIQERQRLARELHDAVSQSVYSLTLFARSSRDALEVGDQVKLSDSLEQLELNSLAALKEMRLLLYQLRSVALEEGGLVQALNTRFDLVERKSGIQAFMNIDESIELSNHVEQELFRLITEALNNALKHAGANQVSVSLQTAGDRIVVEVWDNGHGFDLNQVDPGMGLQNMRERTSGLGGCFEIASLPTGGAHIRVEIPSYTLQ